MKRTLLFLVGFLILTDVASALPPMQHLAQGSITTIDNAEIAFGADKRRKGYASRIRDQIGSNSFLRKRKKGVA